MPTVIHDRAETACPSGRAEGDRLWLSAPDLEQATGWALKPEGLCKGSVCVPVPPARAAELIHGAAIDVAGIWRHMGHPVVHDRKGETWVFGTGAGDRASALRSLDAPDFELPDLSGKVGRLSEHRGKKVLLATWASW